MIEAQRISEKVNYDMEMLEETGTCRGVENYSAPLALRNPGDTPTTLIDFFGDDFLMIIDESHVTLPQVRGMYNGDRARKQNLVDYGFRLPSALDNRPLKFDEFNKKLRQVIYVSATPGDYELELVNNRVVEQIIRPTGLLDPTITVKPTKGQIDDLINEISKRISLNERVLITTLTIRMAEELTSYLKNLDIKVAYLHNEVKTLERTRIIRDLRMGKYDVLVGINLLREGIDIPEVSLIAIMDADKQGFLRSSRSLIQTIGRCARNSNGHVIMYADYISDSMEEAISETRRRRAIQEEYNRVHGIVPKTIIKEIRDLISNEAEVKENKTKNEKMSKKEKQELINKLTVEMRESAKKLEKWEHIDSVVSRPAENRGIMGATALLTQPAIDASNHKVDKETRRVSVNRTIAKIIAGTGVGMFVVRGPIYKGILSMTNIKGNSKFSKALLPKKYLKELNDNPKFLKNYRSALAMAIALLAMCVTNFVLDAPLTAMLTNYLNEKTEEKKHE